MPTPGVGSSTVYDIKKQHEEILKVFANSDLPELMTKGKTLHNAKCVDVDKVLIEWIRQRQSENFPLDRGLIMEQAKIFHEQLNIEAVCEYSTGWYNKFKKRHGLRLLKVCGEKSSVDFDAAEHFIDEFENTVKEEKLTPEQVYNADETSLYWRYIPRATYVTADENTASGFKDSKERITVLACANAAGTHKCKLLIIGRSKNPKSFRGVRFLPVHYRNNKRSWMTSDIFKEWFKTCFIPEARNHCRKSGLPENCKILLILDNCSAHTASGVHIKNNVFVHYLPPNCTSIIQPMDQGILRSLKCRYKKEFLLKMLDACNSGDSISAFQKEFTIMDALWKIRSAWENIPKEILSNGWHKIWPTLIYIEDDDDDDETEEFKGFSESSEKLLIRELVSYAKDNITPSGEQLLSEEAVEECFSIDNDASIVNKLTDDEICRMVLQPEESESSEEESEEPKRENVSIDKCIDLTKQLITGLETKSFIKEEQIQQLRTLQEVLEKERPNQLKQLKLHDLLSIQSIKND